MHRYYTWAKTGLLFRIGRNSCQRIVQACIVDGTVNDTQLGAIEKWDVSDALQNHPAQFL